MSAMPAHRPSMLSSRLNALVSPTTQTIVSRLSSSRESSQFEAVAEVHQQPPPRAICAISFVDGLSASTSSTSPTTNIDHRRRSEHDTGVAASAGDAARRRACARAMATPPSSGTVLRCQRSLRGCATMPARSAMMRGTGTSASAMTKGRATNAGSRAERSRGAVVQPGNAFSQRSKVSSVHRR